ncbi:interferon regulatory factor 10 isoform X4 [Nothobranchius furzeri]|uniref:interferon regulatory factor 10 isoform X4 n=1 Tax=Nothobranchius furzeri TaxID=105023 RepID=UPI002403DBFB|nr:interferon regulatory factor 10 isoform X4 [Nothobranchius furzeri]
MTACAGRTRTRRCSGFPGNTQLRRTTNRRRMRLCSRPGLCTRVNIRREGTKQIPLCGRLVSAVHSTRAQTLRRFLNATNWTSQSRTRSIESSRTVHPPNQQKELFQSDKEEKTCSVLMREHVYCEVMEKKNQIQAPAPVKFLSPTLVISDFRMEVRLLYQGHMVTKVVTSSPDGCFILQGRVPLGNERIYGPCSVQQISFPSPASVSLPSFMAEAMNRLLCHLERGVLLWVAPDGVFIKRFCQGRVYWSGPMAQHIDQPNKLEREKTFKLLDIPTFLNALQNNLQGKGQMPSYQIELCFGEEYPDPIVPKTRKLIMAQVVPLFAVELMRRLNLGQSQEKRLNLSSNSAGKMTLEG